MEVDVRPLVSCCPCTTHRCRGLHHLDQQISQSTFYCVSMYVDHTGGWFWLKDPDTYFFLDFSVARSYEGTDGVLLWVLVWPTGRMECTSWGLRVIFSARAPVHELYAKSIEEYRVDWRWDNKWLFPVRVLQNLDAGVWIQISLYYLIGRLGLLFRIDLIPNSSHFTSFKCSHSRLETRDKFSR